MGRWGVFVITSIIMGFLYMLDLVLCYLVFFLAFELVLCCKGRLLDCISS